MPLDTSRQPGPVLFGSESFRTGLIAALTAGSIALGGNIFTERGQNTTPLQKLGSGAYAGYRDTLCTNTGGLAKYTSCSIQNPLTCSATIMSVQVDSNKAPTGAGMTCVMSADGTATGTTAHGSVFFKYATTASGRSVVSTPIITQGSSGAVVLPPSWYVRCWHAVTPGPGLREQLRVWFNEFFVP